jgi:hypothetical protein
MSNVKFFQPKMAYVHIDASTVGCAQNYTLDTNRAIQEIQCIGSDSITKVSGPYQWNVSFEAMQILTASATDPSINVLTYEDIMTKYLDGASVEVMLMPKVADVSTGQVYYKGTGLIESVNLSITAGEAPGTYSVTVQGTGDLIKVVLA